MTLSVGDCRFCIRIGYSLAGECYTPPPMILVRCVIAAILAVAGLVVHAAEPTYKSPYRVEFTYPVEELIHDILHGDRAAPRHQSRVPIAEWYSKKTREKYGAWGPPRAHLPVPRIVVGKPAEWKRQRVIATGMRYIGLSYQHHHLPDWDPPADWPWKPVAYGRNARGVDCSNFTTTAYDVGLGIKPSSDIDKQTVMTESPLLDGGVVRAHRIERPAEYELFSKELRTGDLVFIKNDSGHVSHVVLWVGAIGRSPDGTPLILDSTGEGRKDSKGQAIPDGVHLRPFTPQSWYFREMSHALRLIPDDASPAR